MGLRVIAEKRFTRTIVARVPTDTGFTDEKFKAVFRALDPEETDKFDMKVEEDVRNLLRAAIVRLDDLLTADEHPIEYSEEVREDVLRMAYVRLPLVRAYFEGVQGGTAKRGN